MWPYKILPVDRLDELDAVNAQSLIKQYVGFVLTKDGTMIVPIDALTGVGYVEAQKDFVESLEDYEVDPIEWPESEIE